MARERFSDRGISQPQHRVKLPGDLRQRLLAIPWVTVVLLAVLVAAWLEVRETDEYLAVSTITAQTADAAQEAAAYLAEPGRDQQVEAEIELEGQWVGAVELPEVVVTEPALPDQEAVAERADTRNVVVHARAPDPRLAALAADTAAALAVQERPDELQRSQAAQIPARPAEPLSSWWIVTGLVTLGLALWVERYHPVRLRALAAKEPGPDPAVTSHAS